MPLVMATWTAASRALLYKGPTTAEIGEAAPLMNAYAQQHAQELYDEFVAEHVE